MINTIFIIIYKSIYTIIKLRYKNYKYFVLSKIKYLFYVNESINFIFIMYKANK